MVIRRVLVLWAVSALVSAAALEGAVSAPVLKWQRGGCYGSFCQTGWYSSPAVADLDGDGQPEVIWGSYDVVALNGANGTLKWRGPGANRVWPGVVVADLTGDGTLEVVVGRGSDELTVYDRLGNVLWTRHPFGLGEIRTLAVEDLESDGRLEIIVGRAGNGDVLQLSVYEPDGTVRPGWPARRAGEPGNGWGMYNENVAVGDLNGDGFKEVFGPTDTHYITALDRGGNQLPANPTYNAAVPAGPSKVWSQVGVHVDNAVDLRGYANCGTEHRPNFATSAPAIADLDGDGTKELIVVGNVYNCATSPYTDLYFMPFILNLDRTRWTGSGFDWTSLPVPGPGSAPLSEDYTVIENATPNAVVADLDGDGRSEILYSSYDGKVHAYWLDKTEHGSWPYVIPGAGFRFASEPIVADLDRDGQAEVIFASWPQKGGTLVGQIHILSSSGVPLQTLDLPASFPAGGYNGGLGAPTLANIDGDADLELVLGTVSSGVVAYDLPGTAGARILWGTGRGSYKRAGTPPEPAASATWVRSDFNGDGHSDILWRHAAGSVYMWLMSGTGLLSSASLPSVASTWDIAGVGDFSGDGNDDVLWRHVGGSTYMWLLNGATLVGQGYTGAQTDNGWQVAGIGDFDGDHHADILWRHRSGAVHVWLMNGTSVQSSASLSAVSPSWQMQRVGDFNGDGKDDLLWRETGSGQTYLWLMNGTTLLGQGATAAQTDNSWQIRGVGDLNGDHKADILWRHGSGAVYAWLMDGTGLLSSGSLGVVGLPWTVQGLGDFDGDGKSDVLWREGTTGATYLWFMNGAATAGAGFTAAQTDNGWRVKSHR